jgi:hypothetical protein
MKNLHFTFAVLLLSLTRAFSQNADNDQSLASNRDVIHFNNGVSLNCEVVEVAENIVFYEQIPSSGLLSASLSEVKELELGVEGLCTLSDSTKNFKRDPLYRQGKRDAKKYYKLRHKSSFQTPKNPRNSLLSNPTYAAGYKAGAKSKKTGVIYALCFPVILPLTLLLFLAILSIGYSGGSGWL